MAKKSKVDPRRFELAGVLTDVGGKPTFHSCGTAADFHCSFPVSFSGCSPLKPAHHPTGATTERQFHIKKPLTGAPARGRLESVELSFAMWSRQLNQDQPLTDWDST